MNHRGKAHLNIGAKLLVFCTPAPAQSLGKKQKNKS